MNGHHHHSGIGGISRHKEVGRLKWVLAITLIFMVAEIVGGVFSKSLALLADAGHMFTDVAALSLSLFAMRLAQRPPSKMKTFGYVRLEILAALINGATLLVIAGLILLEAWQRLRSPVEINGIVMLSVAVLGLGVNVVGAVLLRSHAHNNLNVRGAYLHVLGDLLGSVGAIFAGVIIVTTGWTPADPIISGVIALLILFGAWKLVREAAEVLLEAVPTHVNVVGAVLLRSHAHDNLNVRGAYLHVLGDLLGSVGAIFAGVIIVTTGWTPADPIISGVIALLILFGAWKLVREAAEVLLEAVPTHVDMDVVLDALRSIEGLDEVHDVHVWTLTSGFVALSAHGVIDDPAQHTNILDEVRTRMANYDISHVTFQIEMRTVYQIPSSGSEP